MSEHITKLAMPKWGLSMTEGKIVGWLVDEGSEITAGDELVEVETEKIAGTVEAPAAGTLRRRIAEPGAVVPVGGLLGVLADASVPDDDLDAFVADFEASFEPAAEADTGPQPELLQVGGQRLRVLRAGEGPPVLLLHGFGGDLDNWLFLLGDLADDHHVIAVDLPGHGESSKDVGAGSVEVLVAAAAGVLDATGVAEPVHVVGHSMGGLVGLWLALDSPARVASLALLAPAGFGSEIDDRYIRGFVEADSRREVKDTLELLFADEAAVTRQLVADVLAYKRRDGVDTALRTLSGALFPEGQQTTVLADRLAELAAPLMVIWGASDQVLPAAHAHAAEAHGTVHVLDGVGHSPHLEAAGEVGRLLRDHLAVAAR